MPLPTLTSLSSNTLLLEGPFPSLPSLPPRLLLSSSLSSLSFLYPNTLVGAVLVWIEDGNEEELVLRRKRMEICKVYPRLNDDDVKFCMKERAGPGVESEGVGEGLGKSEGSVKFGRKWKGKDVSGDGKKNVNSSGEFGKEAMSNRDDVAGMGGDAMNESPGKMQNDETVKDGESPNEKASDGNEETTKDADRLQSITMTPALATASTKIYYITSQTDLSDLFLQILREMDARHDNVVKDCDAAILSIGKMITKRTTSSSAVVSMAALKEQQSMNAPAVAMLPPSPTSPSSPVSPKSPTSPTSPRPTTTPGSPMANVPSVRDVETAKLFAGSPTYAGDTSAKAYSLNASTASARKGLKSLQARLQVWSGKHRLMAGQYEDALLRLEKGVAMCKASEDFVWEAIALEGAVAAKEMLATQQQQPAEALNGEVLSESVIGLLVKQGGGQNPAIRKLIAEISIRAANQKLKMNPREGLERAVEMLSWARRLHAEHATMAWYMSLEALLWKKFGRRRLQILCAMEAFYRFVYQNDFTEAFAVVEDDFPIPGIIPFGLKKGVDVPIISIPANDLYIATTCLRKIVKASMIRTQDRLRFTFYAFQLLDKLSMKKSTLETREETAKLIMEMSHTSNWLEIESFKPTYPVVESIRALGPKNDPWPEFELVEADNAASPSKPKRQTTRSAFLYSPFQPTSSSSSSEPKDDASQEQEVFWIVGEDAWLSLTLRNPLDVPVSLSISVRDIGQEIATKVIVPGRQSIVVNVPVTAVSTSLTNVTLNIKALGGLFILKFPSPTCVDSMPLLRREGDSLFRNIGRGIAYVLLSTNASQDDFGTMQVKPNETCPKTLDSTIVYTNREARPRLVRKLLPRVPLVSAARRVRADTEEHLVYGSSETAALTLQLPESNLDSLMGKSITVRWNDHFDLPPKTLYAIASNVVELRVPMPLKYNRDVDSVAASLLVMSGDDFLMGMMWQGVRELSETSSTPPSWIDDASILVSSTHLKIFEFGTLDADTGPSNVKVESELVAFKIVQSGEKNSFRCADNLVVWCGPNQWSQCSEISGCFSFLEKGEYVLAWATYSTFRLRWWIKSVKIVVVAG